MDTKSPAELLLALAGSYASMSVQCPIEHQDFALHWQPKLIPFELPRQIRLLSHCCDCA